MTKLNVVLHGVVHSSYSYAEGLHTTFRLKKVSLVAENYRSLLKLGVDAWCQMYVMGDSLYDR